MPNVQLSLCLSLWLIWKSSYLIIHTFILIYCVSNSSNILLINFAVRCGFQETLTFPETDRVHNSVCTWVTALGSSVQEIQYIYISLYCSYLGCIVLSWTINVCAKQVSAIAAERQGRPPIRAFSSCARKRCPITRGRLPLFTNHDPDRCAFHPCLSHRPILENLENTAMWFLKVIWWKNER